MSKKDDFKDAMNANIATVAMDYFGPDANGNKRFEYGRQDVQLKAGNDGSRLERDTDGDGLKGVDCSSLVWRALNEAGYDVQKEFGSQASFTTRSLFDGNKNLTEKAERNFDKVSLDELKPGDLLMFKGHVAIFTGYSDKGEIQFFGSQTSTGPASVTVKDGTYWDGKAFGAIRPKVEFAKDETVEKFKAQTDNVAVDYVKEFEKFIADNLGRIYSSVNSKDEATLTKEDNKVATDTKVEYTVKKGDTLTSIAKEFGVSINDITKLNPGLETRVNLIRIGEKFNIPQNENHSENSSLDNMIKQELKVDNLSQIKDDALKEVKEIMDKISALTEHTNNNNNENVHTNK